MSEMVGEIEFKDSAVGRIPKDWEVREFSEVTSFIKSGLSRRLSLQDIGLPVINSGNLFMGGLVLDEIKYWYEDDPQGANTQNYILNDRDILLNFINSTSQIGKSCLFEDIGRPAIYTTNIFRIAVNHNTDAYFVHQLMMNDYFQHEIKLITKPAVNQASFTKEDLSKIKVKIPPLPEQEKIASILTSVDEVIEKTESQISKLQDLKKGMMQELLTKGIGHTEFKDSELGRIPKSWEVGALSSLADFTSGFAFSASDFSETGTLCIRMGNLYNNEFNPLRSPQYLPNEFVSQHPKFVVSAGDLLMSMTGTAGKEDYGFVVEVPNHFTKGLLNQRVGRVTPKNHDSKTFIRELMRSRLYLEQLFSFGSGTKQANLSQSQITGIIIPIPSIEEQKRIGETVSTISKTINSLTHKLAQTQNLKKSLMQDLLTGKVRVSVS